MTNEELATVVNLGLRLLSMRVLIILALGGTGRGAFLFLAAFSVASVALAPFAAAASVRLNLAS